MYHKNFRVEVFNTSNIYKIKRTFEKEFNTINDVIYFFNASSLEYNFISDMLEVMKGNKVIDYNFTFRFDGIRIVLSTVTYF